MSVPEPTSVVVTEVHPIQGTVLSQLLEAIRGVFSQPHRILRLTYARGEPLRVERLVPYEVAAARDRDAFLTPFAAVRAYAQIVLQDSKSPTPPGLHQLVAALSSCHQASFPARAIVCRKASDLDAWLFPDQPYRAAEVFRLRVYEDPETPAQTLLVCGSATGDALADIEYAVLCPTHRT